ncbi:MAG: OmpA family protein [Pseudomonadota bacterium]
MTDESPKLSAVQRGRRAGLSLARAERLAEASRSPTDIAPEAEETESKPEKPGSRKPALLIATALVAVGAVGASVFLFAGAPSQDGAAGEVAAVEMQATTATDAAEEVAPPAPTPVAAAAIVPQRTPPDRTAEAEAEEAIAAVDPVTTGIAPATPMLSDGNDPVVRRGCAGELHATLQPLRIEFQPGDASLAAETISELEAFAQELSGCSIARVRIDGFADPIDGNRPPTLLSWRRAQAVFEYLEAEGFEMDNYTAVGNGAPRVDDANDDMHHRYVQVAIR